MTLRGKLVRDRIPEIIRRSGCSPIVESVAPEDYERYVHAKLREELAEYFSSGDIAELADLVEVCFAAAAIQGVSQEQLLEIARDKRLERCGFDRKLVWMGNMRKTIGPHQPIDHREGHMGACSAPYPYQPDLP